MKAPRPHCAPVHELLGWVHTGWCREPRLALSMDLRCLRHCPGVKKGAQKLGGHGRVTLPCALGIRRYRHVAGMPVVPVGAGCSGTPPEDAMATGFACHRAAVPAVLSASAAAGGAWRRATSRRGRALFPGAGAGPAGRRGSILQANYEAGREGGLSAQVSVSRALALTPSN